MFLNLFWTGSRAENLLAVLPLIFVVKKIAPRYFRPFASVIAIGVMAIMVFETIARTTTLMNSGFDYLAQSGMSTSQFLANQLAAILRLADGKIPHDQSCLRYGESIWPCVRLDSAAGTGNDDQRAGDFTAHSIEGCQNRSQ